MRFHLFGVPSPATNKCFNGMRGYAEIIETISWGLTALGHSVTQASEPNSDAINIVFGGQILGVEDQKRLRPDTIFYNLEQMRGVGTYVRGEVRHYAQNFQVWEYSAFNIDAWRVIGTAFPVKLVPISFAPILERIPKAADQDIDVLMYGITNEQRLSAFHAFGRSGLTSVFLCGIFGEGRDALISRAKTVVNVGFYKSRIFEVARVSYLMANRKAVIADIQEDTALDPEMTGGFHQSSAATLAADVRRFVSDDRLRSELEERAFETISRRDIRATLRHALS